jgi:two-component system sensor histidine kinase UhpB
VSALPIRLLIVEDDKVDRLACRRVLMADPDHAFEVIEAETGQEGLDLAASWRPDCILLDYHLPDLTGLEFLTRSGAGAGATSIPVMMLTGADSAAVAAESMRRGARDYLVKDVDGRYLKLLPGAVHGMLREQKLLSEKLQIEAKFRTLVEQIQAIIYIAPAESGTTLLYVSPQIAMLGFSPAEWLSDRELYARQLHPDDRPGVLTAIDASRINGTPLRLEYRLLARDGSVLWFRDEAKVVADEMGGKPFIQGLLVDITRNKLAEQALECSHDELRKLSAHQETIKEGERTRIAQEIHDELGGLLTGINAYISVVIERSIATGGAPEQLLVEAAKLVKNAMETVRKVITDLRPSVLDQLGIWAALEWYMEQVGQRSGLECACRIDPDLLTLDPGPERSTMLFRIAQEALTNVERHAGATELSMDVERDDAFLIMRIHDNGKGIDSTRMKNQVSWGIRGMSERARHFHGEVQITGARDTGTTLLLTLPLGQVYDKPND